MTDVFAVYADEDHTVYPQALPREPATLKLCQLTQQRQFCHARTHTWFQCQVSSRRFIGFIVHNCWIHPSSI